MAAVGRNRVLGSWERLGKRDAETRLENRARRFSFSFSSTCSFCSLSVSRVSIPPRRRFTRDSRRVAAAAALLLVGLPSIDRSIDRSCFWEVARQRDMFDALSNISSFFFLFETHILHVFRIYSFSINFPINRLDSSGFSCKTVRRPIRPAGSQIQEIHGFGIIEPPNVASNFSSRCSCDEKKRIEKYSGFSFSFASIKVKNSLENFGGEYNLFSAFIHFPIPSFVPFLLFLFRANYRNTESQTEWFVNDSFIRNESWNRKKNRASFSSD